MDLVQKQWKTLRGQFTREHRLMNMYEPSGTGNNTSKRPRKTWYLYECLLFLAPHVAHRRTSSNFVRRNTITQSLSTSQQLTSPSTSASSYLLNQNLYNDDSNASTPDKSTSSDFSETVESSVTISSQPRLATKRKDLLVPPYDQFANRNLKKSYKEQEQLSQMIGNTTEVINKLMHNLSEKQSVNENKEDGEETAMSKAFLYALKRIHSKYKIQCYVECLSVLDRYQNMQ